MITKQQRIAIAIISIAALLAVRLNVSECTAHIKQQGQGKIVEIEHTCSCYGKQRQGKPGNERLEKVIRHAGGSIKDLTYSNSMEAIELSYKSGLHYIELDFNWTIDRRLVVIHDWNLYHFINNPQKPLYIKNSCVLK
jgi:hypothetical protein